MLLGYQLKEQEKKSLFLYKAFTSEPDLFLLLGIIPVAGYRDGGDFIFQLFPLLGTQREIQRPEVLFEVRKFRRAGYGDNPRFFLQKPTKGKLG